MYLYLFKKVIKHYGINNRLIKIRGSLEPIARFRLEYSYDEFKKSVVIDKFRR